VDITRAGYQSTALTISPRFASVSYIEAALEQLQKEGFPIREEDVARLSPLLHQHINMLGRYSFAMPDIVARGGLRPLRQPDDPSA
jgi:Tn3 transposase DDE domain